jgi:hypothetical protein
VNRIPTNRDAVRAIWDGVRPGYEGVTNAALAGRVLTDLVRCGLDILAYRRLGWSPDAIQLVSSDRSSYLNFEAANEVTADIAVQLSQALSLHVAGGNELFETVGERPPWYSCRILVLATADGAGISRLDLDPEGLCKVSWHGPFDTAQFSEIAIGFSLFVTHIVANVFDDDEGQETFEESFDWVV